MITCVLLEPVISIYRESMALKAQEANFEAKGRKVTACVTKYAKCVPEQGRRIVPYVVLADEPEEQELPVPEAVSAMEPGQTVTVICCESAKGLQIRPETDCQRIKTRNLNKVSGLRKSALVLLAAALVCVGTMAMTMPF